MAVTAHVPPLSMAQIGIKAVSFTADTLTAALCTGDSSPWTTGTVWGRKFASDMTTAYTEIGTVGTYTAGYAGRVAVAGSTFAAQAATNDNIVFWTCTSPIAFGGGAASITARTLFINDKSVTGTTADTNSYVLTIVDFGATVSSTAGAYTYTVSATAGAPGLVYFTCA